LFIESKEIVTEFSKESNVDNLSHFYKAYADKKDIASKFDKTLLELSLDNGNLLLVIDGIDEVIAKLGNKFDINLFIENINNCLLGYGKTKIIITCRDYFWDKNINGNEEINTVNILPFNEELAEKFFLKELAKDTKEIAKCLKLAEDFKFTERNQGKDINIYIPYILDVIRDLVKQNKEFGQDSRDDIVSELINTDLTNDYFIGRICNREIEKLNNLKIDQQLTFFMKMAVDFNGIFHEENKGKIFSSINLKESENLFDLFKGHTLIEHDNQNIYFRYDFFKNYFLDLYISTFLTHQKEMNANTREILINNVKYKNSFSDTVCSRVNYDDELKLFIIGIIESMILEIKKKEDVNSRKVISSMVFLLLGFLEKSNTPYNAENRTNLMIDVFGNNLDYISIMNLFGENIQNINFDFRDKKITNAWFENFSLFWECKFNEETSFFKGYFGELEPKKGLSIPALHDNFFIDCDTIGIADLLEKNISEKNNKEINTKKDILSIFGLFKNGSGGFNEQKTEYIESRSNYQVLSVLLKNKVITPYKNPKKPTFKQYKISDEYMDIINILDQRGNNYELQKILCFFK
jgi:glutaredoxin-related protein